MGPSSPHTAGVNDDWLFNQRGSTVRVSRLLRRAWFSLPLCDIS
ncbi:MAG: hypothetical protein J07HR59_01057, partial [Halorubrum sp. J07HR59]